MNLENGFYYMMEGAAVELWQRLSTGRSLEAVLAAFVRSHPGERAHIEETVAAFVEQLKEEGLLSAAPDSTPDLIDDLPDHTSGAGMFRDPVMYKYTDMSSLIQMDPIMEFDEGGWPKLRAPPGTNRK